jgi:hypothetical protein
MLIVDAQVHIWSSGTPNPPHRQTSVFSKDELLNTARVLAHPHASGHSRGADLIRSLSDDRR